MYQSELYIIKFKWDYSAGYKRQIGEETRVFDYVEEAQKEFEELDSKFDRVVHRPNPAELFVIELSLHRVPFFGTAGEEKLLHHKLYEGGKKEKGTFQDKPPKWMRRGGK